MFSDTSRKSRCRFLQGERGGKPIRFFLCLHQSKIIVAGFFLLQQVSEDVEVGAGEDVIYRCISDHYDHNHDHNDDDHDSDDHDGDDHDDHDGDDDDDKDDDKDDEEEFFLNFNC